jgi:hypothetical protein
MWNREQGFALPLVMAVSVILFLAGTLLIHQVQSSRLAEQLYGEQLRVQYAAEGGIAMMQQQLHDTASPSTIQLQIDGIKVRTEVITKDANYIHVRSTAKARWGVQQTIQVQLAVQDLAIVHWFR